VVGELIAGRFALEENVGSGGMASVYRAHDRLLERPVALKMLHDHYVHDEEAVERFQREARSAAQLAHPNIVTVIDRGEDNGRPYIVYEYVGGENLKQLVVREGALPVPMAIDLGLQIARALECAHERGVVHRDVKPQNVLLGAEGRAKVTDFGIAHARDTAGITLTGTIMGTSDYIAPEQARGEAAGEASDIYSLGVVLFELLTGRVPYQAETPVAVAMKHVHDPVPSARAVRPDVPPRLDALVRRCLAKAPGERFASMSDLIVELEACRRGDAPPPTDSAATIIVPPVAQPRRRRGGRILRTLLVIVLALVLVAAAAVGAYVLTRGVSKDTGIGPGAGSGGGSKAIKLTGVTAYDPFGTGPPGEHNAEAPLATDGNASTSWQTEDYRDGLNKPGVGLVLANTTGATVRHMTVTTDTPGFTAEIQAGDTQSGQFTTASASQTVTGTTTFSVSGASHPYYVVWITNLGTNHVVHINEVTAKS
jgi:serine/threonine-protein kinase